MNDIDSVSSDGWGGSGGEGCGKSREIEIGQPLRRPFAPPPTSRGPPKRPPPAPASRPLFSRPPPSLRMEPPKPPQPPPGWLSPPPTVPPSPEPKRYA